MTEPRLDPADHGRIAEAIRAAERTTSAELFAVVARASDDYRFAPLLWAALATLAGGFLAALLRPGMAAGDLALEQAVALALLAGFASLPRVRTWLVPRFVKEQRARRHAMEQFLAHNVHATEGRTGVLLFVSLAERFVAVIADKAVNDKVPEGAWTAIVDRATARFAEGRLADGMIEAIGSVGAILAEHFPPGALPRNELPDALVEI